MPKAYSYDLRRKVVDAIELATVPNMTSENIMKQNKPKDRSMSRHHTNNQNLGIEATNQPCSKVALTQPPTCQPYPSPHQTASSSYLGRTAHYPPQQIQYSYPA